MATVCPFALIQRIICPGVELFRIACQMREDRKAYRSGQLQDGIAKLVRQVQCRANPFAQLKQRVVGGAIGHRQGKFVAAKPGDMYPLTGKAREPVADLDEHAVADHMSVLIIDGLETIEIDHSDSQAPARRSCKGEVEVCEELTAVGKTGQGVEIGQPGVFLVHRLQFRAGADRGGKMPELNGHHQQHGDRHQHRIDRHADKGGNA